MDNDMLIAALDSAHLPEQQEPEVLPALPDPSSRGETVSRIVLACGLADSLAGSVCLNCQNSVLAQDSKLRATLYCRALFRDLETCIVDCTEHLPI